MCACVCVCVCRKESGSHGENLSTVFITETLKHHDLHTRVMSMCLNTLLKRFLESQTKMTEIMYLYPRLADGAVFSSCIDFIWV